MKKIDLRELNTKGFSLIPLFLTHETTALQEMLSSDSNIRFCLQKHPELIPLKDSIEKTILQSYPSCQLVRSILFNKTSKNNWSVLWHQDSTISVKKRVELTNYGPWSIKDGVPHVRPPVHILENMITARFHFDYTDENNGALKVIPGSHIRGILTREQINSLSDNETTCKANAGDLLLMKPLICHSSNSATNASPRRILHLEFLTTTLPESLELIKL